MRARARASYTYTHTHVFWGSCWTALKVPLFSLLFFVATARTKKIREGRGREKETERKILGESWNPRLETRTNKPRLRLQTSRLNAYSRVPSIVDLRTTTVKKKKKEKNSCVQCVIVPTQVSPLPSTCFRLHMMAGYRVPVLSYTIREN